MPRWEVVIPLMLYSFGVYAFGSILVYHHRGTIACGKDELAIVGRSARRVSLAILTVSLLWFLTLAALTVMSLRPGAALWPLRVVLLILQFLFPPLIMHVVYHDVQPGGRLLKSRWWGWAIALAYPISLGFAALGLAFFLGGLTPLGLTRESIGTVLGTAVAAMFAVSAVYGIAATTVAGKRRPRSDPSERASRRWSIGLFVLLAGLVFILLLGHVFGMPGINAVQVLGMSMPLAFSVVAFYHEARFQFFDLWVKRGLALFATVLGLTLYLALLLPLLTGFELAGVKPFIHAVLLMPLVAAVPWFYRKLGELLDNLWLGRRHTTVEAVKRFLAGLQDATDEPELIVAAERGLTGILHAPVRIDLSLRGAPSLEFDCVRDVPIRSHGQQLGALLLGRRANQMPYFSEDLTLLESLADVFSYMLENLRLRARKEEQERRARELSLQASRSELKALRAQINPHFLFNALNAIAGLIHKDPLRADSTVEQLAEVFRYTLRGSESEWARLEEELDFVEAYLEVEKARFGDRLRVDLRVDDEVRGVRIPTMIVQTLAENAVKHGIAAVRGPARIEIAARREAGELVIEVADSGPGFVDSAASAGPVARGARFGLHNVRERFRGYFGERAGLSAGRDEGRDMTVVRIRLPIDHGLGRDEPATGAGPAGSAGVA